MNWLIRLLPKAHPSGSPIHVARVPAAPLSIFVLSVGLLVGCKANDYYRPPAVTGQMARPPEVDLTTLQKGRSLFAHRCIECHTLPPVWHYRVKDWPLIINSMAHRASLKPTERDAILAYILAVRGQR
jgi:hypothetical protein